MGGEVTLKLALIGAGGMRRERFSLRVHRGLAQQAEMIVVAWLVTSVAAAKAVGSWMRLLMLRR
jgi:hypothetical protein